MLSTVPVLRLAALAISSDHAQANHDWPTGRGIVRMLRAVRAGCETIDGRYSASFTSSHGRPCVSHLFAGGVSRLAARFAVCSQRAYRCFRNLFRRPALDVVGEGE